ncbi:MAG: hypothetical protein AAFV90_00055 [Cyanobacteria bacterium J06634_5]
MSDRHLKRRGKNLLIRSAIIAVLIATAYGLDAFEGNGSGAGSNAGNRSERSRILKSTGSDPTPNPDTNAWAGFSQTDMRQAKKRLKNGDIVFRSGDTWLTAVAQQLATEMTYTHVGVIVVRGTQVNVVHASIEGNSFAEMIGKKAIEEPLADFLRKGNAHHAAIYRLKESVIPSLESVRSEAANSDSSTELALELANVRKQLTGKKQTQPKAIANAAAKAAKAYAKAAAPFDASFDLATAERVYCTELIWRAYLTAGIDLSDQGLEQFSFPFSGQYLTPDALSKSASLQPVYEFNQVRSVQSPALDWLY